MAVDAVEEVEAGDVGDQRNDGKGYCERQQQKVFQDTLLVRLVLALELGLKVLDDELGVRQRGRVVEVKLLQGVALDVLRENLVVGHVLRVLVQLPRDEPLRGDRQQARLQPRDVRQKPVDERHHLPVEARLGPGKVVPQLRELRNDLLLEILLPARKDLVVVLTMQKCLLRREGQCVEIYPLPR